MQLRLDKILTDTGRWSRKESREVIRAGRVTVGGTVVRRPEQKADPQAEEIAVDGAPLGWSAHSYLMLHKPAGVLTATEDRSAPTVLDLVPAGLRRPGLAPVGRLDKDTTGLLLLTDDGALAHALLSPRRHVDKVYLARIEGTVREEDCAAFRAGLTLGDGTKCLPAELEGLGPGCCRVTVREGKYRPQPDLLRPAASRRGPRAGTGARAHGGGDRRAAPGDVAVSFAFVVLHKKIGEKY